MKGAWFREHLAGVRSALPFSFTYDGRPSARWLAEWPGKAESKRLDAARPCHRCDQGSCRGSYGSAPVSAKNESRIGTILLEVADSLGVVSDMHTARERSTDRGENDRPGGRLAAVSLTAGEYLGKGEANRELEQ